MRRALLLTLSVLLCLCLFTGCSGYKAIEPDEDDLTVIGTVDGKDVYLEELRFVAYTYRDMMTARYGDDIFEGEDKEYYLAMLRELVYANITADYAVLSLCAEAGIGLGETSVLAAVDKRMTKTAEELGGMGKYKKFLKENHLTDHMLRRSTEISLLKNELMYVYVDDILLIEDEDEDIYDIVKNEFISVRHIFIPHSEENARENITEVKSRLDGGESFETLLAEYGKDEEMSAEGLFILEGYMTDEYWSVARELSVSERSDVIEDDRGLYIVERLEMNPASIMLKLDYLKELYQTYTFYSIIDERQAALSFVPNDAGTCYMNNPFAK